MAKTRNDRRFCIFYTAQQVVDDLERDGMTGTYFPDLYEWLNKGGYDIVNHYLHTYAIAEEFNPATGCTRAPHTSTYEESIVASLGPIEQEIMEAVGEGRQGFIGGWISSTAVNRLLKDEMGFKKLQRGKVREILLSLGYDYHPGLHEGRVNNPVSPGEGKPRLYVIKDHLSTNLKSPSEIVDAYRTAQGIRVIDANVNKGQWS